ncbi:UDP-N-acetylglucosamine transferase subunit ALG14-like protein [Nymphaea thermarum]|nr:UDP-N-acetylglucosamine transferase subunit ALG14-like protein [Nymphaea thermarum]
MSLSSLDLHQFRNSMQGGGPNYPPPPPPINFGPSGGDMHGYGPPAGRDFTPPGNRGFPQGERRDYGQQVGVSYPQGEQRDPMAVGGRDYAPGGGDFQGERRGPFPPYGRDHDQGVQGNYVPPGHRDFSQGTGNRDSSHSAEGNYGDSGSDYGSTGHPHGGQASAGNTSNTAKFMQIYRSHEVGQSYVTSVGTTLVAMVHALWLILKIRPTVVLCNGPGTCVPLCVAAFLVKVVGIRWSFIFYVESMYSKSEEALSEWSHVVQTTFG